MEETAEQLKAVIVRLREENEHIRQTHICAETVSILIENYEERIAKLIDENNKLKRRIDETKI